MWPRTERLPKVMLPVGGAPFVDLQLAHLADQGMAEVVLCIGHHGEQVRDHVGSGERWGLAVSYVDDGPSPLGTAGALREGVCDGVIRSPFLALYGDSYLPVDFRSVAEAFVRSGAPALMTVHRNLGQWDRSNSVYARGRVVLYDKHPAAAVPEMEHIDYGLSVLTAAPLLRLLPASGPCDLADVYHALSVEGQLAGLVVEQRFYEIGSPSGLADLEAHLRSRGGRLPGAPERER